MELKHTITDFSLTHYRLVTAVMVVFTAFVISYASAIPARSSAV